MLDAEIIEHLESFSTIRSLSAASRTLQGFLYWVPGVSLRFTPGFMLPAAPQANSFTQGTGPSPLSQASCRSNTGDTFTS